MNLDIKNDKRVLSERELADELGLSYWTVRTLRLKLKLPHFRTERRVFYRMEAVQAWMTEQEQSNILAKSKEEKYGMIRRIQ